MFRFLKNWSVTRRCLLGIGTKLLTDSDDNYSNTVFTQLCVAIDNVILELYTRM